MYKFNIDIFNALASLVLLPIEYLTTYLEALSGLLVGPIVRLNYKCFKLDFLYKLTKPFVSLFIQLNDKVVDYISRENVTMLKTECGVEYAQHECIYVFRLFDFLPEWIIGVMLICLGLSTLAICLFGLKRILNSIFTEEIETPAKKFINSDFPGIFKYLTGPFVIFVKKSFCLCSISKASSVINILYFN